MHRAGVVEKIGSGYRRMYDLCAEAGVSKPEIRTNDAWYSITFFRKHAGTPGETPGKTPGKTARGILDLLEKNSALTIPEIAEKIGRSESAVQRAMRELQRENWLVRIGSDKKGEWQVQRSTPDLE